MPRPDPSPTGRRSGCTTWLLAGALIVAMSSGASGANCSGGGPFMPSDGTVTENKKAGPSTDRRHVCVRPKGGGSAVCDSFSPDSVKRCKVGTRWPACRQKS